MKKTTKFLIHLSIFLFLLIPIISFAETPPVNTNTGLVPCNNSVGGTSCDFNALMALVNKVINFILFSMAIPIAAIMFAYAGFKMVIAGGEAAHARTEAKEIFTNTIIGLIIAVAAWLIISTILFIVGYDGTWIGLHVGV